MCALNGEYISFRFDGVDVPILFEILHTFIFSLFRNLVSGLMIILFCIYYIC